MVKVPTAVLLLVRVATLQCIGMSPFGTANNFNLGDSPDALRPFADRFRIELVIFRKIAWSTVTINFGLFECCCEQL